jgi:pimeloyl-ACP methyl ester carboxylesterase
MHLVLIHGAYFGAWVWERVVPELERLDHRATAIDLPINQRGVGAATYARAVVAGMDWDEPAVVVAHSMAGLVAPLVAAERPVRRMIFLAAFLPAPGMSANEQRAAERMEPPVTPTTSQWTDLGGDLWGIGPDTARELFMDDAPADVVAAAVARLRPQCYEVMAEVTPLQAWPAVPSSYVVCRDDRAIDPEWGRRASRDRLGVEAVEIPGAHSPMLTRPAELASLLDGLARQEA